jgi:hypothetical protein
MRKFLISSTLLISAACSGDRAIGPAVVTTVEVTSSATTISVNATAQASALARDQNGNLLTGKTATWVSLNPAVATVSPAAGLITGVSAGTTTIQGTVDGVVGSVSINVIAPLTACNTGLTLVDLPVGGVTVLSAASTNGCIKVPAATGAPADYLVIPANTNPVPDIVGNYVFKSDAGETVPSTNLLATTQMLANVLAAPKSSSDDLGATQIAFETRLRLEERRDLRIPVAQQAYRARSLSSPERFSLTSSIPAVGDRATFKVPGQTNPCTNFKTITAFAKYINDKVIIFTDSAAPSGGFTATDYQQIGDEFSTLIYPTDVSYFGTPLDLDNNSRVIILYTPEINKLTTAGSTSFVGGFFWAGDLFPATGSGGCAQSNMAELFYLLVPDPTGSINTNVRTTATVRQGTRGTIAHEFQHMINASNRIRSPIKQPFEEVWLDEGLAHFAEDAVGRAIRGLGEASNATFTQTFAMNSNDFNAFFYQNFSRFQKYLQNPGPVGPTSSMADSSLAVRGAIWSLLHYTADQYAPGGDIKAYTLKLAGGPDTGVVNLTKNAGGVNFETLVAGWMVANYADDLGISGLSSLYSYKVYNMRSNEDNLPSNGGTYPLDVNTITGSSYVMTGLQARSGSGNYFFISRPAGSPARTFRFLNTDGATAASFTSANWIVLRTR